MKKFIFCIVLFVCRQRTKKRTPEIDIPADFWEALFGS